MMPKTRRTWLWCTLAILIALLLGSLVWLVGQYEQSRFEAKLELDVSDLANDILAKLVRNRQSFQHLEGLDGANKAEWGLAAEGLLEQHPEIVRIEARGSDFSLQAARSQTLLPYSAMPAQALKDKKNKLQTRSSKHRSEGIFNYFARSSFRADVRHACQLAWRSREAAYGNSYFVPQRDGTGYQVVDLCIPQMEQSNSTGYWVITYSLEQLLHVCADGDSNLKRLGEISLNEVDGSRLAIIGHWRNKSGDKFMAQTVLNLLGLALILRIESWRSAPYWMASTPTALALALVLALIAVLWLLYRDIRKRVRIEAKLAREVMQQRRAEEVSRQSLERLQKSARLATLGEIASMLSHELNQPLAAIASYASGSLNLLSKQSDAQPTNEVAQAAQPTQEDLAQLRLALQHIATQSARAGQVIKSIHGFVRRRQSQYSHIQPQALFDAVLPLLELQAKQLGLQVVLQVEPALPSVWCDAVLVEQVIINLARNGLQAMQDSDQNHQQLTLAATLSSQPMPLGKQAVEFEVRDQGAGLKPEVQRRLFTPFFTTKLEGMGLGLSLCRTVIEQHGSRLIYTTSTQPPATGTSFRFKLMTQQ